MTKCVARKEAPLTGHELTNAQIKRTIAEEEKANAQSTQYKSRYSPVSGVQWEAFTQGGGALASPDFGPDGVNLAFDDAADGPVDEEEFTLFSTKGEEGNGNEISFDSGVGGGDLGDAMMDAGTETLGPAQRSLRSQAR